MECTTDIRRDLYANIVLSGGNTMFQGMQSRLEKEFQFICCEWENMVRVVAPPERNFSAWIGGSILSTLFASQFQEMWITRAEYEEFGSSIVHKMFLRLSTACVRNSSDCAL